MKKILLTFFFTVSLTTTAIASEPLYYFSFDGENVSSAIGGATIVERTIYYDDNGIIPAEGDTISVGDGILGQSIYLSGYEALNLNADMSSESYTISYWLKPDVITDCTPSLIITPNGFEAEKFINITLSVDNLSPNIWTHMVEPYDERYSTGLPGILHLGKWSHITMVVDENMDKELVDSYGVNLDEYTTAVALYIDGFLINIGKVPKGICTDSSEFWFGINIWDDLYIGYVDELYIFDTALNDEQVKELYLLSGGDPDAEKPTGSTNNNGQDFFHGSHSGGSVSDEFIPIEQGSLDGTTTHLNSNMTPISSQGVETVTNVYAEIAEIVGIVFALLSIISLIRYFKLKRSSI